MNKGELKDAVAEATGLSGADAERALEAVLDTITATVAKREKVTIPGFGTFESRERSARTGRNPQTGAEIAIAASTSHGAGIQGRRHVQGSSLRQLDPYVDPGRSRVAAKQQHPGRPGPAASGGPHSSSSYSARTLPSAAYTVKWSPPGEWRLSAWLTTVPANASHPSTTGSS